MKKIRKWIADCFFKLAVWIDPSLPRLTDLMLTKDIAVYGTSIVKQVDPRQLFIDPKV